MKRSFLSRAFRPRALAWTGAALLLACGSDRLASSEIGNPPKRGTVLGIIYKENGEPAPGTRVGLLRTNYDPVRDTGSRIRFDTTDEEGAFSIDSVDSGSYNIQALQLSARTRLLIQGVEVRSDTTVASARRYLQEPGTISILIPDSVPTKNAYVYLQGTDVYAPTSSLKGESRLVLLDSVPAGMSPEITYRSSPADSAAPGNRVRLSEGVNVMSGDTVPASILQEWPYSSRIFLNTTSTGANMKTLPVHGFPALVRLGPGASVFAAAAEDGRDVRFTKPDGASLRHEIESWDRAASQAAIWVWLDTVRHNDSGQYIRMYWGNPSAPAPAMKPVFDTASGYQSVWHMEAMKAGSPPTLRDHSPSGNTLSAGGGLSAANLTASPMGTGLELSGDSTTLYTSKSFESPRFFTISLWFKTATSGGGKLIGFGEDPLMVDTSRDRHLWMDTLGKVHFGVYSKVGKGPPDILSGSKALNDGQWHMVAGVLWPGGMVLYVDGNKAEETPDVTSAQAYPRGYWKLGFDFKFYDWPFAPKDLYFKGVLDEVRVTNKSLPKEWFKLAYESQKPDSRFLRFDKR
ncbi:MAG TPA: DUF2341 domain-containing protein [Fibrobacteria bacterium]|nr:DUF2341 domain-containing protein [Fibrobacteria bacterium]